VDQVVVGKLHVIWKEFAKGVVELFGFDEVKAIEDGEWVHRDGFRVRWYAT
jgi:hypothetical protein